MNFRIEFSELAMLFTLLYGFVAAVPDTHIAFKWDMVFILLTMCFSFDVIINIFEMVKSRK